VTPGLSGHFGRGGDGEWKLGYDFVMQPGDRRIPRAPIP
jgi:hypothetical protein